MHFKYNTFFTRVLSENKKFLLKTHTKQPLNYSKILAGVVHDREMDGRKDRYKNPLNLSNSQHYVNEGYQDLLKTPHMK